MYVERSEGKTRISGCHKTHFCIATNSLARVGWLVCFFEADFGSLNKRMAGREGQGVFIPSFRQMVELSFMKQSMAGLWILSVKIDLIVSGNPSKIWYELFSWKFGIGYVGWFWFDTIFLMRISWLQFLFNLDNHPRNQIIHLLLTIF